MRGSISVTHKMGQELAKEFGVSRQTINNALNYRFDSPDYPKIRQRAKELLEKNLKEVESLVSKDDV